MHYTPLVVLTPSSTLLPVEAPAGEEEAAALTAGDAGEDCFWQLIRWPSGDAGADGRHRLAPAGARGDCRKGPVTVTRERHLECAEGGVLRLDGGTTRRGRRRARGPPPPSSVRIAHSPLFVGLPLLADSTIDGIKTIKADEERSVST